MGQRPISVAGTERFLHEHLEIALGRQSIGSDSSTAAAAAWADDVRNTHHARRTPMVAIYRAHRPNAHGALRLRADAAETGGVIAS